MSILASGETFLISSTDCSTVEAIPLMSNTSAPVRSLDTALMNALATSYPLDRFQILVASDGSSDETAAIVGGYAGRGVRLEDVKELKHRGRGRLSRAIA